MATHLPHVDDEAARNELSFQEFFERLRELGRSRRGCAAQTPP
jgi:hypothetical protein